VAELTAEQIGELVAADAAEHVGGELGLLTVRRHVFVAR
jgi:hypothetical protein